MPHTRPGKLATVRKRDVQKGYRVAIVGATSLRGKELKELLEASSFPVAKLTLYDDSEALGQLTQYQGEPSFVQPIAPDSFQAGEVVFFASSTPDFTRTHWRTAAVANATLVDMTHALLEEPNAVVCIPFLEPLLGKCKSNTRWFLSPHPAVIVLLALLLPLEQRFGLRRAVANVFEPVSERGASGIDELQEQTVGLLSFRELPRAVFDAQVAFNLLTRYGECSHTRLEDVESFVVRELEHCAPTLAARTALRLLQAPVFHGVCVSVWAELGEAEEISGIEGTVASSRVRVLCQDESAPAAIDSAGRDEILVGPVVRDRSCASAFWLWAAADNLRLAARNAVEIAEHFAS